MSQSSEADLSPEWEFPKIRGILGFQKGYYRGNHKGSFKGLFPGLEFPKIQHSHSDKPGRGSWYAAKKIIGTLFGVLIIIVIVMVCRGTTILHLRYGSFRK